MKTFLPTRGVVTLAAFAASAAIGGTAAASLVIDDFTSAGSPGANGSNYFGLGTFSPGVSGGNYMGSRLLCTNMDLANGTATGTMAGNGQFVASVATTSPWGDTQLISQYLFSSSVDMTNSTTNTVYVSGSGTASGGGSYVDPYDGETYFSAGYGIGVCVLTGATTTGTWDDRMWLQFNMGGTQSLGNFAFTLADLQASVAAGNRDGGTGTFDFANVNAVFFYQYAYGNYEIAGIDNGTWNYTATGFSFVPAPGALALLGAAGMIGGTRRRR